MPIPAIMHCIIGGAAIIRDADRRPKADYSKVFGA